MHLDVDGLRRELAIRGMSQAQLAAVAGVTEATVSHAMVGRQVDYRTLRKFARAITVTPVLPGTEGIIAPPNRRINRSAGRDNSTQ